MKSFRQIMKQMTSDKKKLSLMIGLMAVMMLLWGRLILKEVPRTATANPEINRIAEAWNQHAFADSRMMLVKVEVELPTTLSRDLFTLNLSDYVSTQTKPVVEVKTEKSGPKVSDEERMAQEVRVAATGLKLQTTIVSDQKMALINGKLVREGDFVKGFEVISIKDRQVLLSMNGIELKLEM